MIPAYCIFTDEGGPLRSVDGYEAETESAPDLARNPGDLANWMRTMATNTPI
jgi:hypothetical protein